MAVRMINLQLLLARKSRGLKQICVNEVLERVCGDKDALGKSALLPSDWVAEGTRPQTPCLIVWLYKY